MKIIQTIKEEGWKGFMDKWKKGIEQVTPLQQTNAQITFTKITLVGIFCGFVAGIIAWRNLWWLCIILGAAFGNTYMGLLALKQKKKLLEQFEVKEDLKGGE